MAVLAWLADHVETIDSSLGPLIKSDDPIVDSAIDWVDETLGLVRGEQDNDAAAASPADSRVPAPAGVTWSDLGR
jgi:hypothetical protein